MFPIPSDSPIIRGIKCIEASISAGEFQITEYWEKFIIAFNVKV